MATGACGINCEVCGLYVSGACSSCGPGTGESGLRKLAAQEKLLGAPCPILACAAEKRIEHCTRDCGEFPCARFNGYPYSEGYLAMQARRRKNPPERKKTPVGNRVVVPKEAWDDLDERERDQVLKNAQVSWLEQGPGDEAGGFVVPVMNRTLLVDPASRRVFLERKKEWIENQDPLLALITLVYLANAAPQTLSGKLVAAEALKEGHFFQGPHVLPVEPIAHRFGGDLAGFSRAAQSIGGVARNLAEASALFFVFPKIPVSVLLWAADEEFPARVSMLFDSSVEAHLAADGLWGAANYLADRLLKAPYSMTS